VFGNVGLATGLIASTMVKTAIADNVVNKLYYIFLGYSFAIYTDTDTNRGDAGEEVVFGIYVLIFTLH
jgi:hypothetical protein